MASGKHRLNKTQISKAIRKGEPVTLNDGGGLYFQVLPTGRSKVKLDYRYFKHHQDTARKGRTSSDLGEYPCLSLQKAREIADTFHHRLVRREHPADIERDLLGRTSKRIGRKRREKLTVDDTFQAFAEKWLEKQIEPNQDDSQKKVVWSKKTADGHLGRFRNHIYPAIGDLLITDIDFDEVEYLVEELIAEGKGPTARKCLNLIGLVMRYAMASLKGKDVSDPTPAVKAQTNFPEEGHFPAATTPEAARPVLQRLYANEYGDYQLRVLLRLAPILFCRSGDLRRMKWSDLDLEKAIWNLTINKKSKKGMKELAVPLPRQALHMLDELRDRSVETSSDLVFPSFAGGRETVARPYAGNSLNNAMRRAGIDTGKDHTHHGWRACARTMLRERLGYPVDVIEVALAHVVMDGNGDAYNRARFLPQRKAMMQRWADFLDEIRAGEVNDGDYPYLDEQGAGSPKVASAA